MKKRLRGIAFFAIIYNILGLIALSACKYGWNSIARADSLNITHIDYTQIISIIIMVLFFLSSFMLLSARKEGVYIPVLLLTFFIFGGFVLLVPLLVSHLYYFTRPTVDQFFA